MCKYHTFYIKKSQIFINEKKTTSYCEIKISLLKSNSLRAGECLSVLTVRLLRVRVHLRPGAVGHGARSLQLGKRILQLRLALRKPRKDHTRSLTCITRVFFGGKKIKASFPSRLFIAYFSLVTIMITWLQRQVSN